MSQTNEHHHHRHHKKDSATIFKEKNLRAIEVRKKVEVWLKYIVMAIAVIMVICVFLAYTIG